MRVISTGSKVGARKTAERELGAVGAAAGGHGHRLDAHLAVGLHRVIDQELLAGQALGHVAVLLAELDRHRALVVAAVEQLGDLGQHGLAIGELLAVEVAHDVLELQLGRRALDVRRVIEALAAAGVLGALPRGHELLELAGHRDGVDHDVLGGARVDHHAAHGHRGLAGAEALVVDLAQGLAVHRVAVGGAESVEVEKRRAVADLLVGHEGDLQRGVRELGVRHETGEQRADLGDAGLVVGAEQRGAVRDHDVLANEFGQVRDLIGRGLDSLAVDDAGHQGAALVGDDVRVDARGRGVGRGVEVRAEHEGADRLGAGGGGQRARHVGVLVDRYVGQAKRAELVAEDGSHLVLALRGGRDLLVIWIGLGIDLHKAQETLKNVAHRGNLSGRGCNALDSTANAQRQRRAKGVQRGVKGGYSAGLNLTIEKSGEICVFPRFANVRPTFPGLNSESPSIHLSGGRFRRVPAGSGRPKQP